MRKSKSIESIELPIPGSARSGKDGWFPDQLFRVNGASAFDLLLFLLGLALFDDGVCEYDDVVVLLL